MQQHQSQTARDLLSSLVKQPSESCMQMVKIRVNEPETFANLTIIL